MRENEHDDVPDGWPLIAAERLVEYEEAKAAGDGSAAPGSLDPDVCQRLGQDLSCIDLLHRVWPDFQDLDEPNREPVDAKVLGDFRIFREIGRGGMGVVYEAKEISLDRQVALKVLPFAAFADDQQLRRFKNEARAAATLQHPHIVPVYSVGCERGVHYYAMQLVEGPSLAQVLSDLNRATGANDGDASAKAQAENDTAPSLAHDTRRDAQAAISTHCSGARSSNYRTVSRLGLQIAEALAYAHENGVLHRDIKPANILLDRHGRPWVTDFGLARLEQDVSLTRSDDLVGTLRYMAPEQVLGKHAAVDHRADIYGLGVTLYELLTLRPAFTGRDRERLLQQIAIAEPRALRKVDRSIPVELETIVRKAISKNVSGRYDSAQELADDLQRFLDHKPILAKPPGPLARIAKWRGRRPAVAGLVAVSVLAIAVLWASTLWHARTLSAALRESERNRKQPQENELTALDREEALRNFQYALRMKLADEALKKGDAANALELLEPQHDVAQHRDLRGFEWYFLRKHRHRKLTTLTGHVGQVNTVAYSPDDQLLATASDDCTVRIWDAETYELLATLVGHSSCVNEVQFASSGKWLATGSCDGTVKIWDAASFREKSTLGPHKHTVGCLAISPDDRTIAAGLMNLEGSHTNPQEIASHDSVVLWDAETGKRKTGYAAHINCPTCAQLN